MLKASRFPAIVLPAFFALGMMGCGGDSSNGGGNTTSQANTWEKTYGGADNDCGRAMQETSDGGYIITGYTADKDVYLIKTDSTGNLVWEKTYGGTYWDIGYSVQETSDSGYIIAGTTYSADFSDVYLIKTDSTGNLIWEKTFGGTNGDYGWSAQETLDSGYIIAGSTVSFGAGYSDVYLIKTNSSGNLIWEKTFGGTSDDYGRSVQETSDGGYIIAGYTSSSGEGYCAGYLIKTDSSGNVVWEKTLGGAGYDKGYSVQETSDGGYIIAGYTTSSGAGSSDVYFIKTDSSGNVVWEKTFGGTSDDYGYSVQETPDSGYIIAGGTSSFGAGSSDVYFIKTDSSGNVVWEKTFGGTEWERGYSVQETSDSGYTIAGYTNSFGAGSGDVYLIKTDSEGNVQ